MIKQKKTRVYHRSSMIEHRVMGVSHGYRLKPLCKAEAQPLWSKKVERYWDKPRYGFYYIAGVPHEWKCKKCEKLYYTPHTEDCGCLACWKYNNSEDSP